ncbi:sigma-E factor negative regulatory protein [Marinimicrobium alkaliphilum]|uniref:sigma-E factor negative regulatory protein n=1 Tax=Marinimicrobium alkaliphilum TaxID=2202654 RepID=UPI000DBA1BE2|nr:sigma-E factor negative regulatory protein [Marinimicrobium alkaliphilum]
MTEPTHHHPLAESLSALMDDQADEMELQRLLKASESDAELKATWSRYQMASASLRRDLPATAPSDFGARLSAALADEPALGAGRGSALNRWWQNAGRVAVAASVAAAVIFGVQQYGGGSAPVGGEAPAMAESERSELRPSASAPAGFQSPALNARPVSAQSGFDGRSQQARQVIFEPRQANDQIPIEQIRAYLNLLIDEHTDHASFNSGQGMLPFARAVVGETDEADAQEALED